MVEVYALVRCGWCNWRYSASENDVAEAKKYDNA